MQEKLRLDELESLRGSTQEGQDVYYTDLMNKETGLLISAAAVSAGEQS